jgi:hypothetical protein
MPAVGYCINLASVCNKTEIRHTNLNAGNLQSPQGKAFTFVIKNTKNKCSL